MTPDWMKELQKDNEEFSQLVHDYYKLAVMRVMQVIRKKYSVPPDDIHTLHMSIFSRMLNEGCYSVGANIREDYPITNFFLKEHLLNLLKVLNGERLFPVERKDIDMEVEHQLEHFKKFIMENASDFYI